MAENRISASLAPADKEAVMQAIATIREKLPFLVDLTPEDRRTMLKMGDKSRAFVSKALQVATQNPNFLPRYFDLEEMRRDLEIYEDLYPVLLSSVEESMLFCGSNTNLKMIAMILPLV